MAAFCLHNYRVTEEVLDLKAWLECKVRGDSQDVEAPLGKQVNKDPQGEMECQGKRERG